MSKKEEVEEGKGQTKRKERTTLKTEWAVRPHSPKPKALSHSQTRPVCLHTRTCPSHTHFLFSMSFLPFHPSSILFFEVYMRVQVHFRMQAGLKK